MRKIESIEGLRGLLALWVVFGHTIAAAGLGANWRGPFKVMASGGNAVEIFIIISGFVIFYLLDVGGESYGRFIWRRFLRLYPAYLLCLLVSAILLKTTLTVYQDAPWPHPLNLARIQIARASLDFLPRQFTAHLLMMHSLIPDWILPSANYAILGQAWSLSLEWQFYLLAPLLFAGFARGGVRALAILALACAVHLLVGGNDGFLPRHIPLFALGIASYYLWRHPWRLDWPLLAPAGVALAYLLTDTPAIIIWALVFLAAYQPRAIGARLITGLLEAKLAQSLGKISYSVYLSHSIILVLAMALLERAGAASAGQYVYFAFLAALTFGGTLCFSVLLYRLVEAPCIALGKRSSRRKLAAA